MINFHRIRWKNVLSTGQNFIEIDLKQNPYWFDTMLDELYKVEAVDVSVVENIDLEFEDDDSVIDEAEDTLTILSNYIDTLNIQKDKKELDILIQTLYNEALDYEITA